jgi:hypothetical protein
MNIRPYSFITLSFQLIQLSLDGPFTGLPALAVPQILRSLCSSRPLEIHAVCAAEQCSTFFYGNSNFFKI